MPAKELISEDSFINILENVCNFVSILETGNRTDAIESLICLVIYEFYEDSLKTPECITTIINDVFSIEVETGEITSIIDTLIEKKFINITESGIYSISENIKNDIYSKKEQIKNLEISIKEKFLKEIKKEEIMSDPEEFWKTLYFYLSLTFRRHGMQASALLSGEDIASESQQESLTELLNKSIEKFLNDHRDIQIAKKEISKFMASVSDDDEKAKFIVMLADGAFNYFLLSVDPIASKNLRSNLEELTILLDTNFLFGILSLHNNLQVSISNNLLYAISKHNFPFKLKYKEKTLEEIKSTLSYYGGVLKSREWAKGLSRAAVSLSNNCSGIELKFHELNKNNLISPDEFLRPYMHVDVLLKEKNIELDKESNIDEEEAKDICSKYKQFLEDNGKWGKSYNVMYHDASLLLEARKIRKSSPSSLNAGALILTCDYYFYKFDIVTCKHNNIDSCVLLPSLFWQILRPYIPTDSDWDRAFASTFSLPEFRTISSRSSAACTKMLQMLAVNKNISEESALKILSNDILIQKISQMTSEDEIVQAIENEFVNENVILQEEIASLRTEIDQERKEYKIEIENNIAALNEEVVKRRRAEHTLEKERQDAEREKRKAEDEINAVDEARKKLEQEKAQQKDHLSAVQRREFTNRIVIAVVLSVLISGICLFVLNSMNTDIYGISLCSAWGIALQASIFVAIFLLVAIAILKEYRKPLFWILLCDGFAIAITLLSSMPNGKQ